MIATNHALTGAVIGLSVHNPVVAVVAAFASHFICDMIPHFDFGDTILHKRSFAVFLAVDALLCIVLVAVLFTSGNPNWLLASLCAFVATSPDLLWIRQFVTVRAGNPFHPTRIEHILKRIQWFERPSGAFVEAAWAIGAIVVLSNIL